MPVQVGLPGLIALAALLACGGCRKRPAAPREDSSYRVEPSAPARVDATGLTFPLDPPVLTPMVAVRAFPKLDFDRPLWIGAAPDDRGRLFVLEQSGRILVFDAKDEVAEAQVFLDIRDQVRTEHNEEGLLGLAFDPDFARTGALYLYYSASRPRRVQISRFVASNDRTRADPASEQKLLVIEQPYGNHNGGWIAFGPDRHLYLGVGDGGAAGDPERAGQDLGQLLAKVLRYRVRPDGSLVAAPDNPFVGKAGARPEIWAFGLRNPWRCSFDRTKGTLWCGDVGQDTLEEIDIVTKGGNYGWRLFEGTERFGEGAVPTPAPIPPIVEYGRREGQSVTGGYVYRGTHLPGLRGAYVYGDYGSGNIWALWHDGTRVLDQQLVARVPEVSSFGEDADGELYAVSLAGRIYRFEPAEADARAPAFPKLLSETGIFADLATLAPNPGVLPYDVTVELWSDGAQKQRWMVLPAGATIEFAEDGPWRFPVGTVLVKHFEIELAPGRTKRLETRVMVHERPGWSGYTYRWNDAQTDARLLASPETETLADGQRWYYPAGADCLRCHTPGYGEILGLRTRQVAGSGLVADWSARKLFDRPPPDELAAHPRIDDESASLEARARAYLDVNCAICHHPGGPAPGSMDMRVETTLAKTGMLDVPPDEKLGMTDERRIAPGRAEASAVFLRMTSREPRGMPPLASNRVDQTAVGLMRRWVDGLPR